MTLFLVLTAITAVSTAGSWAMVARGDREMIGEAEGATLVLVCFLIALAIHW